MKEFEGHIVPSGCYVKYKPSKPSDKERVHSMGDKMLDGAFMLYGQNAGGDWNGDYYVLDLFEMSEAAKSLRDQPTADQPRGCITLRRIKAVSYTHLTLPTIYSV